MNWAAFAALSAGAAVYLALLNPLAMTGTPLFTRLSASVPAVITACAAHVLLARAVVMRAGKGAYGR